MNERLESKVRELDEKLIRNHRRDANLFAELSRIQTETGILHDERPICPFLRPHFFPRSRYAAVKRAAEKLHAAFERMTEAALADAALMAELELTEKEERLARIDPRYPNLCVSSRLDAFLSGDEFKFLEYNAETPAGIGDQLSFEKVFERVAEVQAFLANNRHWRPAPHETLLHALVKAYRQSGGKKEKPAIAIVDWEGVSTASEFEILRQYWSSRGFPTVVANPFELEYDGKQLRCNDFTIDIFYKRVVIHEFLETFDDSHPLVRAYADGNVCMANSFRVKLAHKKTSFAVLSDEKYARLFTAEQLELIRRHIPWTRRVRDARTTFEGREVELLELLRARRESFILKPHDDYGGHGVSFGWEHSESSWERLLDEALRHCFVAQERVPVEKASMPMIVGGELSIETLNIDFDPFLFNGEVDGGLVRLSANALVNVTQGGGETALVVLEDF